MPVTPSSTCVVLASQRRCDQFGDRGRLVARGLVFRDQLERLAARRFSRAAAGLCGVKLPEVSGSSSPRRMTSSAMAMDMAVHDAFRNTAEAEVRLA